jgi:cyclopropane fatty-acyl-phospholipid synthase-like methyltransferase
MAKAGDMENDRDDYQQLALDSVIASEKLCASLAIPTGARVLDIGCRTGHAAIAAARRRAT